MRSAGEVVTAPPELPLKTEAAEAAAAAAAAAFSGGGGGGKPYWKEGWGDSLPPPDGEGCSLLRISVSWLPVMPVTVFLVSWLTASCFTDHLCCCSVGGGVPEAVLACSKKKE